MNGIKETAADEVRPIVVVMGPKYGTLVNNDTVNLERMPL